MKSNEVDAYLAAVEPVKRAALESLRAFVSELVPEAEECISYQIPTFKLNGKSLVAFGASRNHCSFYTTSGSTLAKFEEELASFNISKGTVRFTPEAPSPKPLLEKIVLERVKEITA